MTETKEKKRIDPLPALRLKELMAEDKLTQAMLTEELVAYDPEHFSLNYDTNISRFLKSRITMPLAFLMVLQDLRGYNRVWIMTGKGDKYVSASVHAHIDLPLLKVEDQAARRADLTRPGLWPSRHRVYGYALKTIARDFIIEVADSGMWPQLNTLSRVRCRMIQPDQWGTTTGVVACAFTDESKQDRVVVRRFVNPTDHYFTLSADSADGESFNVHVEDIYWLASVERIIDSPVY